jgi:membrane protein
LVRERFQKPPDFPFWLSVSAAVLLMILGPPRSGGMASGQQLQTAGEGPFGEPRSSEEPRDLELDRAHERGRGRQARHPLQIPWRGWYDIVWRTYQEMNSGRLLSIAGGVSFFVLLAIFPAITALVSAYGLFFNTSTITNNLSLLNDVVPENVLSLVHEQANRIASNSGRALSIGIIVGILVSLWSAMSGVKAMIDALNVINEQQECRSFIKLNLVALVFTLAGLVAFLLAIAAVVILPFILSPIGLESSTETLTRIGRWPILLLVLLIGLSLLYRYGPDRRAARWQWVSVGSVLAAVTWISASFLFSWYLKSFANYNATYGSWARSSAL